MNMRAAIAGIALQLLPLLVAGNAFAQTPSASPPPVLGGSWSRYAPASVRELKATLFDYPENHVGWTVNAAAARSPYRIKAVYLGELRTMPPQRLALVRDWWGAKSGIGDAFTRRFERELLVETEGERIWMPVQTPLIEDFRREMRSGDAVELYVMAVGTLDDKDIHDWVFIINEFQAGDEVPFRNLRDRAEQGDAMAQVTIGVMHDRGEGVAQDYAEALRWFRMAAASGNPVALHNIGTMYADGRGVAPDLNEAFKWYLRAAERGDVASQFIMGRMHLEGTCVERDIVQAYKWFDIAATGPASPATDGSGAPEARSKASVRREEVAKNMTPAQIAEARKLAGEWRRNKALQRN